MHKYFEPEVSGGFGNKTKLDNSSHPPIVEFLHFEFNVWLENDIIECFPCFIVTEALKSKIEKSQLTGISFSGLTVSTSETFKQLYPSKSLPKFHWMKIEGTPALNDFGVSEDHRLVVSTDAFTILEKFNISEADIEEYP